MRVTSVWIVLLLGACAGQDLILPAPPPPPPAPQTFRFEIAYGQDFVALGLGATLQLAPRMIGTGGDTLAVSGAVSFVSRVPSVISVSASGLVTALTMGSSTISASAVHAGQVVTDTLAIAVACTNELTARMTPVNPVVLSIGGRFTPTITLTTCGGHITLTDPITWSAADPSIVSVHPTTGETVGLRAGVTLVIANMTGTRPVAAIQVTVQ